MTLKERIIRLSGEDYRIVNHCDTASQAIFLITGLFIPIVFMICWTSCFITFRNVFDSMIAVMALSLFFSWMITNLYRLLIYTFSRNPLPQVNKKMGRLFSRAIRLAFMCFIATMIAKPIESLLYADLLDRDIAAYKARAKKYSHDKIFYYYQRQIDEITSLSHDSDFGREFLYEKLQSQRAALLGATTVIDSSGFFLQRLRFLCTDHRSCWWVTCFFLLVFIYPIVLKYHLRNCIYYQLKGASDQRKINLNYYMFRKKYAMLFKKFHDRQLTFSEYYEDPPYKTIRKEDRRRFLTEKEFISGLYHV